VEYGLIGIFAFNSTYVLISPPTFLQVAQMSNAVQCIHVYCSHYTFVCGDWQRWQASFLGEQWR